MQRRTSIGTKSSKKNCQKDKFAIGFNKDKPRDSKLHFSQESNADIDGFSSTSSASDVEANISAMIVEPLKSLPHVVQKDVRTRVEEWRRWDTIQVVEKDDIAWSNSSSDNEETYSNQGTSNGGGLKGENEEEEVEEFQDITLVGVTESTTKRKFDVTIKEFCSDDDDETPAKLKPFQCEEQEGTSESSSQPLIEELSPSPAVTYTGKTQCVRTGKTEIFKCESETEFGENDYSILEDSFVAKKTKISKGGLAERLQKVIAREKSELAFWKHDYKAREKMKESTLVVKVVGMSTGYSTICLNVEFHEGTHCYIVLPSHFMGKIRVSMDCVLRVYPPWKRTFCSDLMSIVLLCAYHFELEVYADFRGFHTRARKELLRFHEEHINDILSAGFVFDFSHPFNLSMLETTRKETSQENKEPKYQTIIEAIEKSGIYKDISLSGVIQRVLLSSVIRIHSHDQTSFSNRIASSQENEEKEQRYGILLQDNTGALCEISLPCKVISKNVLLQNMVVEGEGKFCEFKNIRLIRRRPHTKDSSLRSMMESFQHNVAELSEEGKLDAYTEQRDWIEDPSTQSMKRQHHQPPSNSYLFVFEEGSRLEIASSSPEGHVIPYVRCRDPPSPMHTLIDGRYLVHFKTIAFTRVNVGENNSNIGTDICFFYGLCTSKDCHRIHNIKRLPTCVISEATRAAIDGTKTNNNGILYFCFKDLYVCKGRFIADAYTRIYLLDADTGCTTAHTMYLEPSLFEGILTPMLSRLECSAQPGDLVEVLGVICGVDEETALFWNVCTSCGSEDVYENDSGDVWCEFCERPTSNKLKMQLDLFLYLAHLPRACVLCKLLESTIRSLLPTPSDSGFQGYDMRSVLDKKFGPLVCQVVDILQPSKQEKEHRVFLREVTLFSDK